jgi:cellulose synthase/poly-beta-1,6-N-acetylglucosamine synthase-like glycosyltransferase
MISSFRSILDVINIGTETIFDFFLIIATITSATFLVIALWSLFSKKKDKEIAFDESKIPFVTIQIPTYNELAAIGCAKKCLNFDYPKDKYEILIGDDSNNSYVSKKLQEFASKHDLVTIHKREKNIGYKAGNLNNMLKYSKGEFLVLFDSDYLPEQDFLKRIIAPFQTNKNIAGVQARWAFTNLNQNPITLLSGTIITVVHHLVLPLLYRRKKMSFLCGSAEAVRKSTLEKLGGWETGSLTEDIEYALRMLKNNHKIVYLEDLECKGELPFTAKDLYRQQMRWAYGVIKSFVKHSLDILRNKQYNIRDKIYINIFWSGYLITILIFILFLTGIVSFITTTPAPIDLSKFLSGIGRNIGFTSGLIFACAIAQYKAGNTKKIGNLIVSAFSYGLVVTYYVNIGIYKAIRNKPMQWFLLKKTGNKL